jgi:hypothetical protein
MTGNIVCKAIFGANFITIKLLVQFDLVLLNFGIRISVISKFFLISKISFIKIT